MTASETLLTDWSDSDFATLERAVVVANHRLHETDLFTDDALIDLIDAHPEEDFSINTMGVNPEVFDWREGDRNEVDAATLLDLVRTGQLWINCRRILQHHPKHAAAIQQIFDELKRGNPDFIAEDQTANLLISSPSAWVPYHVDMPVNMLWHIRGSKRVWVYPPYDQRFAPDEVMQKVCSGKWSEDVPYESSFDKYALVYDAQPGQVITWPQLTPHRVTNLDGLNVSLSTEHKNPRAQRQINVHTANEFLNGTVGWQSRSSSPDGVVAHAKQVLARGVRYAGKFVGKTKQQFVYPKTFLVDPDAEHGFRLIDDDIGIVAPHETTS